jgi:hypothetical protein
VTRHLETVKPRNVEIKGELGESILKLIVAFLFIAVGTINLAAQEEAPIGEWIVLGNSFALHNITSFWWGNWGMAASRRDSDFCHVLNERISKWQNKEPVLSCYNIADWERDHGSEEQIHKVAALLSGREALIVIRVGECVNDTKNYEEDFETLIDSLRLRNPQAKIFVTGNFWPNYQKEIRQEGACNAKSCVWCPLRQLCQDENLSDEDSLVYGDDLKWHKISDGGFTASGVANHPNDRGHRLIAESLFDSVKVVWRNFTGIRDFRMDEQLPVVTEYFDLSGRRVNKPTERGIYIIRTTNIRGQRRSRKIFFDGQ